MIWLYRKDTDFDCSLCEDRPTPEAVAARKEKLGCTGKSRHPHIRGGVRIDICPARFVQPDVIALDSQYESADGRLTLTERSRCTPVYAQAWDWLKLHKRILQQKAQKEAYDNARAKAGLKHG